MNTIPTTIEEFIERGIQCALKGHGVTLVCSKAGTRYGHRTPVGLYSHYGEEKIRQIVAETRESPEYGTIYLTNDHFHVSTSAGLKLIKSCNQ